MNETGLTVYNLDALFDEKGAYFLSKKGFHHLLKLAS